MKDELKIKYFKNVFEVFASAAEGRYPFYADYLSEEGLEKLNSFTTELL